MLTAALLFGLGWLFVWVTSLTEEGRRPGSAMMRGGGRIRRMLRVLLNTEVPDLIAPIMASWNHPFIILMISIWAIGRGSAAVAAEVERGTMDLGLLSRADSPVGVFESGVIVSLLGLVVLSAALMAGGTIAVARQRAA